MAKGWGERKPVGDGTEDWHGTTNGYDGHYCGCERCRAAHRAYRKAYFEAHPDKAEVKNRREAENRKRRRIERGTWFAKKPEVVPLVVTPPTPAERKAANAERRRRTLARIRALELLKEEAAKATVPVVSADDAARLRGLVPFVTVPADDVIEFETVPADDVVEFETVAAEPQPAAPEGKLVHLMKPYSKFTICSLRESPSRLVTTVISEATCPDCRSVPHRRHHCQHCGTTIEPLEPEKIVLGRSGVYNGQRRYFHAIRAGCMAAARKAAGYQSASAAGGLGRSGR